MARKFNFCKKGARARTILQKATAPGVEALEERKLFASFDYVLDGNFLTTYTNGVAGAPAPVSSPVTIPGDVGINHVVIQNFTGTVNFNGLGGGDVVNLYAGSGTTLNAQNVNTLVARAPLSVLANVTVDAGTKVTVGSDVVNYDNTIGTVSVVGQLFSNGDTLTVNGTASGETITVNSSSVKVGTTPTIFYSTFASMTVNANGGNDSITSAGTLIPTSLTAGAGTADFTVTSNSVALTITGGNSGTDTFNINSNSGPLTITGQGATNNFIVNGNAASLTLNGGSAANTYQVNASGGNLILNGAGTSNNLTVSANSGTMTVNGGTGTDSFTVNASNGSIALNGGTGTTTYLIAGPTLAPVTVNGNASGTGNLTFRGTVLPDVFNLTSTTLNAGTGATVTYSNLTTVAVDGISGSDTFNLASATTAMTLIGGNGVKTFNLRANTGAVTVNTGAGTSTVNVGSNVPSPSGNTIVANVGAITVNGNSSTDTLNIDDAADSTARTGQLSQTALTGLGFGGVTYNGLVALNIKLGSAGDTLNITGSAAGTATNVNLGAGVNTINIGSLAPATGGIVDNLAGALVLTGSNVDTLVVDDSGSAGARKTGTLSPTNLTGLGTAGTTFGGFNVITINLGGGAGNDFSITDTLASVTTTVNDGAGDDSILVTTTHGTVNITGGTHGGTDSIAIQATAGTTNLTTGNATDILVGTLSTGGLLSGIQGALAVSGDGTDHLTLADLSNSSVASGAMTDTAVTGFGMGASGVTYAGLATLAVAMGSGSNTFTVNNTAAITATTVTAGNADDTVNVRATQGPLTIDVGTGANVVNVGSTAPAAGGITGNVGGTITLTGNASTTLNIDDAGNASARSVTVQDNILSGLTASTISYNGVSALNVTLGSGVDDVLVRSTSATTVINTGDGADQVGVHSAAPVGGDLQGLAGALTIDGGGTDVLLLDDSGDAAGRHATLTSTTLTDASPTPITYSGVASLTVKLGTEADTLDILGTIAGSTSVDMGGSPLGGDVVNVQANAGTLQLTTPGDANTISVGSTAPVPNGNLDGIVGAVTVTGSGTDTLNLDDSASSANRTGTLTGTTLTGITAGGITYTGLTDFNLALGGGNNTLNVLSTNAGQNYHVSAANGDNVFNVRGTSAIELVLSFGTGADVVNVSSLAPNAGGTLADILGDLTLLGSGTGTLNVNDDGNSSGNTGTITPTQVTGLSTGTISYLGIAALNVNLGGGADDLTVTGTSVTTNVNTGVGADDVTVYATSATLAVVNGGGSDAYRLGDPGASMAGILAAVTLNGGGNSSLLMDNSGNPSTKTASQSATVVSGLAGVAGTSPDITFSGLTTVDVKLGSGGNWYTVSASPAGMSTTVHGGAGADTLAVGTGSIAAVDGPVALVGNGDDALYVDDPGGPTNDTGSMTGSTVNLSGASITYSGAAHVLISTPAGVAFGVLGTAAGADTIITAIGGTVTVGGTGAAFQTANVNGPLTVNGAGVTKLVVDDSSGATDRTVTMAATSLTGAAPVAITFSGLADETVKLGNGSDTVTITDTITNPTTLHTGEGTNVVNVRKTSGATTINTGTTGPDGVNVSTTAPTAGGTMANIGAALDIVGSAGTTLTLDDSGSSAVKTLTVASANVTGLNPGGVHFTSQVFLNILLGSGADAVTLTGSPALNTSVQGGAGDDTFTIATAGGTFSGTVTLEGAGGTNGLTVDQQSAPSGQKIKLTATTITGLGGVVTYANFGTANILLGDNGELEVDGTNPATFTKAASLGLGSTITFDNDFVGDVTLGDLASGAVNVGGNFAGHLTMQGGLGAMNIAGNMLSGSSLLVNGALGSLAIGGYQAGTITAASAGTVSLGAGVAGVNGSVLAVNAGGVMRTIRALGVDGTSPAGTTFKVLYDAVTADVPQAAVRVTASDAQQRFDVLLESPANSTGIDLSRLDSAGGIRAQVRNVNASGDLLETISDAQAAFFGDAAGSVGGVYLPLDNLGAVAVGGHMGTSVIKAISIQGVGFSTMQGPQGATWSAAYVTGSKRWWSPLLQSLMTFTRKPFRSGTKMVKPTESLLTPTGTAEAQVGLFVGTAAGKKFNRNAIFFSDQRIDDQPATTATVTYGNRLFRGRPIADTIAFAGDGGSVDTFSKVGSITSNAGVGDVMLRLGRAEVLQGIFAPEVFGTVNLFGGKRLDV